MSHSVSSAYHPESQGVLELWHQTLEAMLMRYCVVTGRDWDEGLPFMLFAIRDAKQESLGFSPSELVFGHKVRGTLKVLQEKFTFRCSPETSIRNFVTQCKTLLQKAISIARESLAAAQGQMKERYDRKLMPHQFKPVDQVLVLTPVPGNALSAKCLGPYVVDREVSEMNYVVSTPEEKHGWVI